MFDIYENERKFLCFYNHFESLNKFPLISINKAFQDSNIVHLVLYLLKQENLCLRFPL